MATESYTDEQLVAGLISGDRHIIEYFFYKKCSGLLAHILIRVFDGKADPHELLNELYIYLAEDDWRKLRQFDFRSRLTTWLGVVAIRFFQKKRDELIENVASEALNDTNADTGYAPFDNWTRGYDVHAAISKMSNERYRNVIQLMDIQGETPDRVAEQLGVSVANLYNIRHRAHAQLAEIIGRKEDWYD